jgi:hypothetical protein
VCIRQIVVDSSVPVLLLFLGSGGCSLPLLPTATFRFADFGLTVLHRLTVLQEPSSPHPPTLIFFYQASTQCLNPVYFASAGTALAALHGKTGGTEIFRQTGDSHRLSTSRNKKPNAALRVASHTAPSLTDLFSSVVFFTPPNCGELAFWLWFQTVPTCFFCIFVQTWFSLKTYLLALHSGRTTVRSEARLF